MVCVGNDNSVKTEFLRKVYELDKNTFSVCDTCVVGMIDK